MKYDGSEKQPTTITIHVRTWELVGMSLLSRVAYKHKTTLYLIIRLLKTKAGRFLSKKGYVWLPHIGLWDLQNN